MSRSASPNPTRAPTPPASPRAPNPTATADTASTAARCGPPRRWKARIRAAWHVTRYAAWRFDNGLDCGEAANSAKYLAAEAGFFAADRAVQTHGGMGYATEYHVERYFREARLPRIAPISQELILAYVSEHVLGLPRSH